MTNSLYTQCTICKQQQHVTATKLRSSLGMITCNQCSSLFNALEHLTNEEQPNLFETNEILFPAKLTAKHYAHWGLWTGLFIIVFGLQVYFFEGYQLTQNSTVRPWLSKICYTLNCQLPVYKNRSEITILHGSFQTINKQRSIFKTAFVNQAMFEQNLPAIKLTLQSFTGVDFAERTFYPKDYMNTYSDKMAPDRVIEIALDLATPTDKMGGYHFKLI